MSHSELTGALAYITAMRAILDDVVQTQTAAIAQAAAAVVTTIQNDGLVYLFGTGHSHMLAEEGHFRAGGFASVCPVLSTGLMIHESAQISSKLERVVGIGPAVLSRYAMTDKDVIVVFSNSGVNAVPVEAAMRAKDLGMTVIAVVALAYASQAPLSPLGKRLSDVADIVIDNHGPPGDALVEVGDTELRTGAASTVAGAFILNAILTEAAWRLALEGEIPPVYISSNMPDAAEHNAALHVRYGTRNPHL